LKQLNANILDVGTMGLTLIDRWAVSGGWLAAYRQELGKLQESQTADMTDEMMDKKAVKYADDVVYRTQPLGDKTELAPLFNAGGEGMKILTQFQTALNVIWNNVTYDVPVMLKNAGNKGLPDEVRKAEFGRAIGQLTGYLIAGALLGAITKGHGANSDDRKKLQDLVYWSFTQFTDSVPLIGDVVDQLAKTAITGEKPHYYQINLYPAMETLMQSPTLLSEGEYKKAFEKLLEGLALFTGLPVSGAKELKHMVTDTGAEALLGRRKNN
jgi:hypothetical protein